MKIPETIKHILVTTAVVLTAMSTTTTITYAKPENTSSFVLPQDKAVVDKGDGWVFYQYFNDETVGTSPSLVGMAVIEAGKEIHPPHMHSDEEFLLVTQGAGQWSVKGEVFDAKAGDLLYAAPWDGHGIKNTGEEDLVFVVFKWQSKGVPVMSKPKGEKAN